MEKKEKKVKELAGGELIEYVEILKALTVLNEKAILIIFIAFIGFSILKFIFDAPISIGVLALLFLFGVVLSGYIYSLNALLKEKEGGIYKIENLCFAYFVANLVIYSGIVHYIGGVEWIGIFIYFFQIVEANVFLSRRKAVFFTVLATISYAALGFLEYFGILPHYKFFIPATEPYKNLNYLLVTICAGAVFGFHYVAFLVRHFSKTFRRIRRELSKERRELQKAKFKLEETRDTLEIRVRARTKELEELAKSLEQQVKERTIELQEKVEELERFQKFAVGREMKMVELKKKIEELEEKLKKQK